MVFGKKTAHDQKIGHDYSRVKKINSYRLVTLDFALYGMLSGFVPTTLTKGEQTMFRIPQKPEEKKKEPLAVNSVEVCKLLGVSSTTLTKWTREGKIPHRRIGRRILYSIEALKNFIEGIDHADSNDEKIAEVKPNTKGE